MRTRYSGLLTLLLAFIVHFSYAQEKTISGNVTDEGRSPLPGVNVVVKGTSRGTQTDFDGNYSIAASVGQTLVFSYIGQKNVERIVGSADIMDVQMVEDAEVLEGVVVTALGIKKEKQALGYSVAEVGSQQLEQRAEGDVARVLSGKASGVNITQQSGLSGSATNVIIRGFSSFSGSNQALFIVDGVPFSSDTNAVGTFVNGNNGSSRFLDIDPNNIESVNVLKGLAASTLYGSLGRNGVILITTKSGSAKGGSKKNEVTINTSLFFNEIASMPDYQFKYGNGFDQAFGWFFSNWGPTFEQDGPAGWGNGDDFDANGTVEHPYSTASAATGIPQAFPEFAGARYAWRPYKSVENFFRVGTVSNTSINFRGASNDGGLAYNLNFGHLEDKGFTPGNKLTRNNLSFGGNAKLTNNFTFAGTLNFARTDYTSPPIAASQGNGAFGSGSSVFGELFFTPISVDLMGLPYQNPITGGSVYYRQNNGIQHPLWTVHNAGTEQETYRVYGNASVKYDINKNLNLQYRVGLDVYNENNVNYQNRGGVGTGNIRLESGIYQTWTNTNTIYDHNLVLNGNYALTDKMNLGFNVGGTTRRDVFDQNGIQSDGQQAFGVLRHFNFLNADEIQYYVARNFVGLYGSLDFDYNSYLYVNVAGRNDWTSNLTKENRSIFYPSGSISFVPTTAIEGLASKNLNYLKVRLGYGTSASFPTGYPIASTLTLNTQDFKNDEGTNTVTNTTSPVLGNPNLKPERLNEIEFGVESKFWDNRISFDVSLFKRITKDLIVSQPLDPSTGYSSISTNIGEIQGKGVEIDLGITPIRNSDDGFNWSTNFNFTANETEVTELDQDVIVYSAFSNLGNAAIKGEPLGVIFGSRIQRNENGEFVINSTGDYAQDPEDGVIGDPNPDFILNIINSLSYKNFTFGFQFNYTQGGDMYSNTISTLLGRGLTTDTEDRENTYILPGVDTAGNPNTIQINNSSYYFNNIAFGPNELQVFDASVIRLQEISLGYAVPTKFLDKTPFGSISLTLSGFNLWYNAFNTPKGVNFDPNVAGVGVGNAFGFEFLNGPSSKRYGFSIKATF